MARSARRIEGWRGPAVSLAVLLTGACSVADGPDTTPPPSTEAPPPPPAACLLDLDALTAATGLDWLPDHTTASDTRCVYDPVPGNGESFLAVTVEPRPIGPGAGNDAVAAVCEAGTSVPAGDTGFVCLLPEGGVFAALTHDDRLVTVAAARVPAGTTAERLVGALAEQLGQPS